MSPEDGHGALGGFPVSDFTADGRTFPVYAAGTGPAVIVIHEMPGLHPGVLDFVRRLVDRGYRVLDERMIAPVLSQPSLPFALGKRRKAAVGVSDADLEVVARRARPHLLRRAPASELIQTPAAHQRPVVADELDRDGT